MKRKRQDDVRTRCWDLSWVLLCPMVTMICGLVLVGAVPALESPVAAVSAGALRGLALPSGGAVFKGIRFAAPPVGILRWREPYPIKPWKGTRDALSFGAPCPQADIKMGFLAGFASNASETADEDCLFLNVWTPEWPVRDRLPVMVWIHGGGNFAGSAASDVYGPGSRNTYDGESLARRGVVVVTTNYRLGTFGFFAHPELTAESAHHASGNYGLLDQIAALRWVHDNIAAFGGDRSRVTIFGESAGAIDIGALMTSQLAKGLFHRAIAESGTISGTPRSLAAAEADGQRLARALRAPDRNAVSYLRNLPVRDLLNVQEPLIPPGPRGVLRNIAIDKYVIRGSPAALFAAARQLTTPLIIGSNTRERLPSMDALPTDFAGALQTMYGPLASRAITLYSTRADSVDPTYGSAVEQWAGDIAFRCDSILQASWHANAGHAAYVYEFNRIAPGREPVGAVHTAEMWYVFGTLGLGTSPPGPKPRYNEDDHAVASAIQRYWANFASNGDPNGPGLARWDRFEPPTQPILDFASGEPTQKHGVRREYCDLYINSLLTQNQ